MTRESQEYHGMTMTGAEPVIIALPEGIQWSSALTALLRPGPLHSTLCNLSSQQPIGFRPTPLSFSPEDSVTQWSDLGLIKFMGPDDVRNFHRSHSSAPF